MFKCGFSKKQNVHFLCMFFDNIHWNIKGQSKRDTQIQSECTYFLQNEGGTPFRTSILVTFPDSTSGSSRSDNNCCAWTEELLTSLFGE